METASIHGPPVEYRCRTLEFPGGAKEGPWALLAFISRSVAGTVWSAHLSRLTAVLFVIGTALRLETDFWSWGRFDGYALMLLITTLIVGVPLAVIIEEFFHAATSLAKNRPDLLYGILLGDFYLAKKNQSVWFLFAAIRHRGERSPVDDIHISAAGPLGLMLTTSIALGAVLLAQAVVAVSLIYALVVLVPILVCGALSLLPIRFGVGSDGANIENARQQIKYTRTAAFCEAGRGFGLVVAYLARSLFSG
jgi:hypothetical protein